MKSRISSKFDELKSRGQKALIAYITAGDPNLKATEGLVHALEWGGVDIIELGVPFSDPLADGPTIQASHARALKNDVGLADVLRLVKKMRSKINAPIVLMLSYNLIIKYGMEKFAGDAVRAGVDGIIPPDLSHDEAKELCKLAKGLDTIFLVAPTSTDDRIKEIVADSKGFVYLVSLAGITGERKSLPSDIKDNVARIRKYSKVPVAVGFGISTPAQVREVSGSADGVIVGSAIVKLIEGGSNISSKIKKVEAFVKRLKNAARAK